MVVLVVLSSVVGVAGVMILADSSRAGADRGAPGGATLTELPDRRAGRPDDHLPTAARAAAAATAFTIVITLSGWIAPAVVVAAAAWWFVGSWRRGARGDRREVERVEALAAWIENLRDVLIAGDQPIGAIASTVSTCPEAIRPQVRRLAAGLGRQEPDLVFRRFADELDDPTGDLVAAGLLLAVRRGGRTAGVLTALAEQARAQSDRRRLVEAERAPTRREVSALTAIMGVLLVGLFVFGRSEHLAAYDTASGQAFLSVALVGFAGLLVRVQRLARFPRPARFLTTATVAA